MWSPVRLPPLRGQYLVPLSVILFTYGAWGGSGANNSTRKARPHLENVAVLNSGCANSPLQISGDFLRSIARIPFLPLAHRYHAETGCSYCGKKLSRAAGSTPTRAAQGMAVWLLPPAAESFTSPRSENFLSIFLNGRPPCRTAD